MYASALALCLLLLAVTIPSTVGDVSDKDIRTIQTGITAGKEFTETLSKASSVEAFTKALRKLAGMIGPWVDGLATFSKVLNLFKPKDTELLDEMKKGFNEVNTRLDIISEGIQDVVQAIDWAVVKINFQVIEQDIRLLNEKLKEVLQAPNAADGKREFIRVYEDEYHEAGTLLWDSIINYDQVFYENVMRAGMRYTEYYRAKMNNFMKGLIALLLKSCNIEVGYEKFKGQDRGLVRIWKERLLSAQEEFLKVDNELMVKWKTMYQAEVEEVAKKNKGVNHKSFSQTAYSFLSAKYSWIFWFVLSYDDCAGYDNHCVSHRNGFHMFRYYGRNLMVSWAEPSDLSFTSNMDGVAGAIENQHIKCRSTLLTSTCPDDPARVFFRQMPGFNGVAKVVIKGRFRPHMVAMEGRAVAGTCSQSDTYCHGTGCSTHDVIFYVFYFG